jgi:uncharacterized protein (DUF2236 family)
MKPFVDQDSIVRQIWGKGDTILFIFAGAAAEFALNKAVDWLYFTGKLPSDPLGRLFSTVEYARHIVFSSAEDANKTIDKITAIHGAVEKARGQQIPQWAYRDVLFMLIHYSIASFEVLERPLTDSEKEEVFAVFHRVGSRMGIQELPTNYDHWLQAQQQHLQQNLAVSKHTTHLFQQYKKHLGRIRYALLLQVQAMVVPPRVKSLMTLKLFSPVTVLLTTYKLSRRVKLDWYLKSILLPPVYKSRIKALDIADTAMVAE